MNANKAHSEFQKSINKYVEQEYFIKAFERELESERGFLKNRGIRFNKKKAGEAVLKNLMYWYTEDCNENHSAKAYFSAIICFRQAYSYIFALKQLHKEEDRIEK